MKVIAATTCKNLIHSYKEPMFSPLEHHRNPSLDQMDIYMTFSDSLVMYQEFQVVMSIKVNSIFLLMCLNNNRFPKGRIYCREDQMLNPWFD